MQSTPAVFLGKASHLASALPQLSKGNHKCDGSENLS